MGNIKTGLEAINLSDDEGVSLIGPLISLVSALTADSKNPKISRAVSAAGLAVTAGSLGMKIQRNLKTLRNRDTKTFSIRIEEGDLYDEIKKMMYEAREDADFASMGLDVQWNHSRNNQRPKAVVHQSFDVGMLGIELEIAGHKVLVSAENPPSTRGSKGSGDALSEVYSGASQNNKKALEIQCATPEIRSDVVNHLSSHILKLKEPSPRFFVNNKWGSFTRNSDIPVRPKESVILKEGQMDRILSYLRGFLEQEQDYVNLGIPYRTGVLLCGKPGSGKSSTAASLAFELGLDIYFVSLASVPSDEELISLMEDVPPRSILILEDIDVAKATKIRNEDLNEDSDPDKPSRSRKSDEGVGGVTMTGLLNSLDGLVSPHGVITLMTTNHRNTMDPAIIRPGRVDLEEHITEVDDFQLRGICEHFLGFVPEDLPYITESAGITSASLVGIFKKYIPNIGDSAPELMEFLVEKSADAKLKALSSL